MRRLHGLGAATLVAGVLFLLAASAAAAIAVAEAIDRPSTTVRHATIIEAPRSLIWRLLTDLEGYADWNPYATRASGTLAPGSRIQLHVEPVGGGNRDIGCDVITVHKPRKLYWRCRSVGPGVLDREHTFRLIPAGEGRIRLTYEGRWEGVLVPLVDLDDRKRGYVRMVDALAAQAKALNDGAATADEAEHR